MNGKGTGQWSSVDTQNFKWFVWLTILHIMRIVLSGLLSFFFIGMSRIYFIYIIK